jgi:hypothetical protein
MNKNYLEGGLTMIDIDKYIEAIQIKWVKKLTNKKFDNGEHSPIFPPGGVAVFLFIVSRFTFSRLSFHINL